MRRNLDMAMAKRKSFLPEDTNAFRLVNGYRDGIIDIEIDVFDGHWVLQTHDDEFPKIILTDLPTECRSLWWKRLDQHQKESPEFITGEKLTSPFPVLENGIRYMIDFSAGYSQGIFLDQRDNRRKVFERSRGKRILNTFAYTCAFSVAAAMGGGTATSLDLSSPYLEWGKRNFEANDIPLPEHYFCKGDTLEWMQQFAKKGRSFHGIILDPPTFSRNKKKVFRVEKDYHALVEAALAILEPGGWILCCTNCRNLSDEKFDTQIRMGLERANKLTNLEYQEMPQDFDGDPYLKSVWVEG